MGEFAAIMIVARLYRGKGLVFLLYNIAQ